MALQSALTNDQLTDIRSGVYQSLQFVCTVPNDVVVQFQPDAAPATDVFAEIVVGSVGTGSMSDIEEGQLVLFSTTTDYIATEFFRTRVRTVSGTSTLYVGENSQTLTTSHYVTVINTYEMVERLRRDVTRVDWDITFRKLRPIETALQSAYVLTNDETTFAPTAVPVVMDADAASISTHAWSSSNSNDTLDSGGTTASPSFTLEAGAFRWIRYTFTDNLGLSNYRAIPVWTVPRDYSNAVTLGWGAASGELANISFDPELGWTCSIPAFDGITTLLNRTFTVVACDEWYGGVTNSDRQSIRTNINFIGYLQTESVQTSADQQHGQISEVQFSIESFGHQLARQNIAPVTVIQKNSSAAAWDEIKNPTPGRMLSYRLTEYSTASTLMAIKLPSDDTDFIGDDLTLSTEKALDDLNFIADVINAEVQFDVTGKLELCRDLIYLNTTARDAAPVVATLTPADFASRFVIDFEYGKTVAQATITGGSYSTTTDSYNLFEAITPAEARYSEGDPFELANQVLTTDNTSAESIAEIAQRAANFLAAKNPTWILRVTLKDQWHFLIPDVGAWFKFTIAATDTVRGKVFGSNDRWQLVQIDISTNSETGTREVSATFRHETSSTGASVRAKPIINDVNADIDYVPGVLPPLTGGDLSLTDGTWYDSQDAAPPSNPNPTDEHCENAGFRVTDAAGVQVGVALNNEYVGITLRGAGQIALEADVGEWCYTFDFTQSDGGFVIRPTSLGCGTWVAGQGWVHTDIVSSGHNIRGVSIEITLPVSTSRNYTTFTIEYSYTYGHLDVNFLPPDEPTANFWRIENGGSMPFLTIADMNTPSFEGTNKIWTITHPTSTYNGTSDTFRFAAESSNDNQVPKTYDGNVTIHSLEVRGTGVNPFPENNCGEPVYGDAFYFWTGTLDTPSGTPTPYPDGNGVLIESVSPGSIPPYSPSHEYTLDPFQVTSGPVLIEYEPLLGTGGLTNWSIQAEVCFLGTDL